MTVTIAPAIARTTHDIGDFSFLQGAWRATERFLTKCGVGSDEWQVREAYLILRPLLGGMANAEEITYPETRASRWRHSAVTKLLLMNG